MWECTFTAFKDFRKAEEKKQINLFSGLLPCLQDLNYNIKLDQLAAAISYVILSFILYQYIKKSLFFIIIINY